MITTISKRKYLLSITFVAGLTVGVLAVLTVQHFVPQRDLTRQGIARGEFERTETTSADVLSSTNTVGVGKFEQIFDDPSPAEQYKALYNTFSQSTKKELKQWWIRSQEIESISHQEIVQHVILQCLTAINPRKLLEP